MADPKEVLRELTSDVVAAYVRNNSLPANELPSLIASVHHAFARQVGPMAEPETGKPVPAVPVKKSVTKDFVICLEDGKRFKSIKRHLMTHHQMTPDEYRIKWDLPADYPMVAETYSADRSRLAFEMGLGRKRELEKPAKQAARKFR